LETALTLAQVAKLLQVAPSTIHGLIREEDPAKRIPFIRVGKNYRFFGSELAKFFNLDLTLIKNFASKDQSNV
jgi:excisionase family DNA binding protein